MVATNRAKIVFVRHDGIVAHNNGGIKRKQARGVENDKDEGEEAWRGNSFCLSYHINTELIKTAELIEFL